ncbi:MAG TPA: hypothetical protein VKA83_25830 [Methylomirabilota bacterium]|nr:hypothetical protein [Methylomirabilota bacterium]
MTTVIAAARLEALRAAKEWITTLERRAGVVRCAYRVRLRGSRIRIACGYTAAEHHDLGHAFTEPRA